MVKNPDTISLEDACVELGNAVYECSEIFEQLEYAGHRVLGNGHHMRQELSLLAQAFLVRCWNEKEGKPEMMDKVRQNAGSRTKYNLLTEIMGSS